MQARYDAIKDVDPTFGLTISTLRDDVTALQAEATEAFAYLARLDAVEVEMKRIDVHKNTLSTLQSLYEEAKCAHTTNLEDRAIVTPMIDALESEGSTWVRDTTMIKALTVSSDYFA